MRTRIVSLIVLALAFWTLSATAGDDAIKSGKAAFETRCAECHYEDDFAGESKESILGMIKGVASGEVEHEGDKALHGLSEQDLANLAAFFASYQ